MHPKLIGVVEKFLVLLCRPPTLTTPRMKWKVSHLPAKQVSAGMSVDTGEPMLVIELCSVSVDGDLVVGSEVLKVSIQNYQYWFAVGDQLWGRGLHPNDWVDLLRMIAGECDDDDDRSIFPRLSERGALELAWVANDLFKKIGQQKEPACKPV